MLQRQLFVVAICMGLALVAAYARAAERLLSRIAFGSCCKQDKPQPIWNAIVAAQPDLFLMLGDNIYGDTQDMQVLRAKYAQLGNQPGFLKLKATCPILATWDDHDYGANDAGVEFPRKRESQQVFLDFFGAAPNDPRRTGQEGVYSAQVFGPPGRRVQIILLDGRYFRSPLKTGTRSAEPGEGFRGRYIPNSEPGTTMLGEAQWTWLERQLSVEADVRLIGSGVQVVADQHGSETWGNFPQERERLFRTIRDVGAQGVVFLSGDRHLAELCRLPPGGKNVVGYPLFDVTSSSLNEPSGNFTRAKTRFANEVNPWRVGLTYFDTNFGMVTIDWSEADPVLRLQIHDEQGETVIQQRTTLSVLHTAP